jgi:hypothetical protein
MGFFNINNFAKNIHKNDVLHLRQFWINVIRAHNTKTVTSVYQEGTALKGVNGV